MRHILRYAWQGSAPNWQKGWVNLIGAVIGAAVFDFAGLDFQLSTSWNRPAGIVIGAAFGVLVVFVVRLLWAPFHLAFGPRGGVVAELKVRFGANLGPIVVMVAAVVTFVVLFGIDALWNNRWLAVGGIAVFLTLFGGGAVWFVWPKRDAGLSSLPFTIGDGRKLEAANLASQLTHLRQSKVEFEKATEFFSAMSSQVMQAYASTGPSNMRGRLFGNSAGLRTNAANKLKQMVQRDFGEVIDLDQHPHYDQNPSVHAPDADKIGNETDRAAYRKYFDVHQTSIATINRIKGQYDAKIRKLEADLGTALGS